MLWPYRDGAGALLFAVVRFNLPDGRKETLPYCCDTKGWRWKAPPAPRPLYGLDRLAARPGAPVLVVEGEKATDAATALFPDHVAICWQGGGKAVSKADWSPLAGRNVTLWPDHDAPGQDAMKAVAAELERIGAGAVAMVAVPEAWPAKWDVADPLPEGVAPDALAAMLADAVPPPLDVPGEIARAAELPGIEYQLERKGIAQRLGLGLVALDKAVNRARHDRRKANEAEYRAKPPPPPGGVRWPYGFIMDDTGLHADAGEAGLVWLAAPFEVLGEARDATGEGWGLWLRWKDRDRREHCWALPHRLLMMTQGEAEAALVDRGLRVSPDPAARMHLRRALGEVQAGSRVTLVERAGWHGKPGEVPAYVMPDGKVLGGGAEALVLQRMAEGAVQMVAEAGTLADWRRDVAALAVGNDVAVAAMSAAFAGPLLDVLGEPSGGLHLFGRSKSGKTAAMRMALSVWGPPFKGGMLRDWRSTANGLEGAAEESGDGLLGLDELHQAEPREVAGCVYMLANESGKGRMRRDTSAARRRTWRTFILSTGELDLGAMVAKAGQKLPAGAEVRLPSIPIPAAGLWPNLHGRASVDALMADLHGALHRQHGTAIRAFLAKLVAERAEVGGVLPRMFAAVRARIEASLPAGADAQVRDVARRFALVAVAGEVATEWGILPWPRDEATRAAVALLQAWVGQRGGAGSSEEEQQVRAIRLFLIQHGNARFVEIEKGDTREWRERHPERTIQNRAGWCRVSADESREYLIPTDIWREVCGAASVDPTDTARTLRDRGILKAGAGKNLTEASRIPGGTTPRCYRVHGSILGDGAGADAG